MVVKIHDLRTVSVYKKNRIALLLCIFETTVQSFYTYWNMEQSHVEGLYAAPLAQGLSIHKPKISSSYHSGPIGEGRKLHSTIKELSL